MMRYLIQVVHPDGRIFNSIEVYGEVSTALQILSKLEYQYCNYKANLIYKFFNLDNKSKSFVTDYNNWKQARRETLLGG